MSKEDILSQYREDQQPVNPEKLGWCYVGIIMGESTWKLGEFKIIQDGGFCFKIEQIIYREYPNFKFEGLVRNQGHLRVIMEMLNIK